MNQKSLPISCVALHGGDYAQPFNSQSTGPVASFFEQTLDDLEIENQKLNDYYECLIECDALDQTQCKRICRNLLA